MKNELFLKNFTTKHMKDTKKQLITDYTDFGCSSVVLIFLIYYCLKGEPSSATP